MRIRGIFRTQIYAVIALAGSIVLFAGLGKNDLIEYGWRDFCPADAEDSFAAVFGELEEGGSGKGWREA